MPSPHFSPDTASADRARVIHLRRQLAAAVGHGTALSAVLGLPQLVAERGKPIDLRAASDALDLAFATLDALDTPGEDWEPEPGYCEPEDDDERDGADDCSGFDEDAFGWDGTGRNSPLGVRARTGTRPH